MLLETLDNELTVGSDGYVEFTAYTGGEFILVSKKADSKTVITLEDQISVKETISIKAGKTRKNAMGLVLPAELEGSAVVYSSSSRKIAKINRKTGAVKAVKKGNGTLTVDITLPDGTVKTLETKIEVK